MTDCTRMTVTKEQRIEAVIKSLGDVLPANAYVASGVDSRVQVGGIQVYLRGLATHIVETLDGMR